MFTCAPPTRSSFRNTLGLGSPMPFSIPFKHKHTKKSEELASFCYKFNRKVKKQNFQVIVLFFHRNLLNDIDVYRLTSIIKK